MEVEERPDCLWLGLNPEESFTTFRALEIAMQFPQIVIRDPKPNRPSVKSLHEPGFLHLLKQDGWSRLLIFKLTHHRKSRHVEHCGAW